MIWNSLGCSKENLSKMQLFLARIHKKLLKNNIFYQKVRDLRFPYHLIWPRWFNFLVHDFECLNLSRFCFSVSYALCIQQKKKTMTKKWKKTLKNSTYLPTYLSDFFGACNPQYRTQTYFHTVESVGYIFLQKREKLVR